MDSVWITDYQVLGDVEYSQEGIRYLGSWTNRGQRHRLVLTLTLEICTLGPGTDSHRSPAFQEIWLLEPLASSRLTWKLIESPS